MEKDQRCAIIAGAGPAGLTAAYEFLRNNNIHPIVFESSDEIGGISKTVKYKGNRMDIGGHRFFSKNERVKDFWDEIMPLQAKPSQDDILLQNTFKEFAKEGPDPELENRVMLIRQRISRIFYLRHFFDYPISLKLSTFTGMGLSNTVNAGLGYCSSLISKREENSLEDFYLNRFGKPIYKVFFEDYTEKVWGVHPSKLGADWGSQRVKGLSVFAILKDVISKNLGGKKDNSQVETSLIEQFVYPKLGPGQLWESVADDVKEKGGELYMDSPVKKIKVNNKKVTSVVVEAKEGEKEYPCDYFLSSMPIKDLIPALEGIEVPEEIRKISNELPYRDFITVGLLMKKMKINNSTKIKTFQNRIPDTWIYIQERDVKIGRLQVFNNWSPYLVNDYENTIWLGLEYFCTEGDEMWEMDEASFRKMAIEELEKIGMIDSADVLDSVHVKIKKAYPGYHGTYYQLDKVIEFLNGIDNLYCIGRNGQHRYNNMDHSMLTAMMAVDDINAGTNNKEEIWSVNTENDYHETSDNNKKQNS